MTSFLGRPAGLTNAFGLVESPPIVGRMPGVDDITPGWMGGWEPRSA